MPDLADAFQMWGGDITLSETGDLATATAEDRSQLRVLRRLLTNPGDYLGHPSYGAGLSRLIGSINDPGKVKALIRGQMRREPSVAKHPEPIVQVQSSLSALDVSINYTVMPGRTPVTLSFTVRP
jgi:hypothetical protein